MNDLFWLTDDQMERLRPFFPRAMASLVWMPYRIHTILTHNGLQFAEQPRNRNTAWSRQMRFAMICEANDIEH